MELLQRPGNLRYAGWDLETLDTPKIVKGEYLAVKNGDAKLIHLYEDGILNFRGVADASFLGWSQNDKVFNKKPQLHSLAIIELTFNFVAFYQKLIPFFVFRPPEIQFTLKLKDVFLENGNKMYLLPYGIGSAAWVIGMEKYPAPDNEMEIKETISTGHLEAAPDQVAYKLVRRLYLWFGLEENKIPYVTTNNKGESFVNVEEIKATK